MALKYFSMDNSSVTYFFRSNTFKNRINNSLVTYVFDRIKTTIEIILITKLFWFLLSSYFIPSLKTKLYIEWSHTKTKKYQAKVRGVIFDRIKTTIEIFLITKLFRLLLSSYFILRLKNKITHQIESHQNDKKSSKGNRGALKY